MISIGQRDITQLSRESLLEDYWEIAQRRKEALVNTALRTRSSSMRDILVHGTTPVTSSWVELKRLVQNEAITVEDIVNFEALADLGRLIVLQNIFDDDLDFGEQLMRLAIENSPGKKLSKKNSLVFAQLLVARGKTEDAKAFLARFPKIDRDYFEYLKAEILNPFTFGSASTAAPWLEYFNKMFVKNKIEPILVLEGPGLPFDRLDCQAGVVTEAGTNEQRLVSVILTAYKPDPVALRTSVKSILHQTWKNLELVIVDDCSGPQFDDLFDTIEGYDQRITLIRSTENQGTYVSRNIGYEAAQGDFITGQDDDDWSHPRRIEEQVKYLDEHPRDIGCRVTAVRCDANLSRVRVGYSPMGENASSLLIRREGYLAAGNYLEARKGADTEYHFRIEHLTGRKVGRVRAPLTIIRIQTDSLSRGDFSSGWKHTSRRSFRSSYEYWHRQASLDELQVTRGKVPEVKIPRRFLAETVGANERKLDVVFAGPWEKFGGPQKSMLEEIEASVRAGYQVGVLNLEAARFMNNNFQSPLRPEIQKLINSGYVDEVHLDDDVEIDLLLLRYPPILQFFTDGVSDLSINRMVIVANQAPSELNGEDIRYRVEDCHQTAQRAFKVEPLWIPQGPHVRRFLENYLEAPNLVEFDLPGVLNINEWWRQRSGFRSLTPVVGRHSRDDRMKWPDCADVLEEVYRTDGSYDIRILGGAESALRVIGKSLLETGWTLYEQNEVPVKSFLSSLDYYVFFQHSEAVEAFGRAVLEAIASGLVVILPRHFQEVFGEAALYCNAEEVSDLIRSMQLDYDHYDAQLQKARRVLQEQFSYASFVERLQLLLPGRNLKVS